jgi:hypothetical protein
VAIGALLPVCIKWRWDPKGVELWIVSIKRSGFDWTKIHCWTLAKAAFAIKFVPDTVSLQGWNSHVKEVLGDEVSFGNSRFDAGPEGL